MSTVHAQVDRRSVDWLERLTGAQQLHGPMEDGPALYEAVIEAGRDLRIERLMGWGN